MVAVQDTLNVGKLAVFGIAGILAIYATVMAVQALYLAGVEAERQVKVVDVPYGDTEAAIEAQAATLDGYGVVSVSEEGEVVHVPLDLAKTQVLEELR